MDGGFGAEADDGGAGLGTLPDPYLIAVYRQTPRFFVRMYRGAGGHQGAKKQDDFAETQHGIPG